MKLKKITLLLIGMMFLMGCSHLQTKPAFQYIPRQERLTQLQQQNWIIQGSLSITYNKKRDFARFVWEQKQNDYRIKLSGPINFNTIKIIGTKNKVDFCQSGRKCIHSQSAEQLLFNSLGWQLPLSNMRYWILSLPALTKVQASYYDQYGHLTALEQQGWKIHYSEFQTIKNFDLPTIIELRNKSFFIKIKIINYYFLPPNTVS